MFLYTLAEIHWRTQAMKHSPNQLELSCTLRIGTWAVDMTYSIPLAKSLLSCRIHFTGMTMKNRANLPSEICGQLRLLPGEVVAYRADHLLTLTWLVEKKKKPAVMLSTCSDHSHFSENTISYQQATGD